jgi:DNA polymerase
MPSPDLDGLRHNLRLQLLTDQLFEVDRVPVPPAALGALRRALASRPAPAAGAEATADRRLALEVLDREQVKGCTRCALSETRTHTVFGQGNPAARLVFVGEAPGYEEDVQGLAFVGRAGQLLTKMIEAMNLSREEVFICNVLKCRPPNNRTPATDEIAACSPYLFEQLRLIQPEVICALGAPAAQTLLGTRDSIGRLRGRFHDFFLSGTPGAGPAIPLMPTYHPAYLLRSPGEKRKSWEDLQLIMKKLGIASP